MELRHLRYFVAVAEEGSLTTAAERRLHTSQPSLSRQIRDLEYQVKAELLVRSVHGVELTAAGRAFLDHARLALTQVDAAVEAARRAAQPARKTFAIGFQTGHEMNWLSQAMRVLRDELKNIHVTVTSDYSPDLAEALIRGRLDVAFMRIEPNFELVYEVVDHEPLIVLMPSDHRLTNREAIHPREFVGEIFIGGSNKATVLRAVTEEYLRRCGLDIKLDHGVDNLAMAISLVASTRGLALMPAYAKNLLPWSVVSWRAKRRLSMSRSATARPTVLRFSSCSSPGSESSEQTRRHKSIESPNPASAVTAALSGDASVRRKTCPHEL